MPGAGTNKGFMLDPGFIVLPGPIPPGIPAFADLTIDVDRPIEKFGQLNRPAGAALYRVVILDGADHEDLVTVVDHMKDNLQDLAQLLRLVIIALHHLRGQLHADIAAAQFLVGDDHQIPITMGSPAGKGKINLFYSPFFTNFTKVALGPLQTTAI